MTAPIRTVTPPSSRRQTATPGRAFYVSAINNGRSRLLAGPFVSYSLAWFTVGTMRSRVFTDYPDTCPFDTRFGVCSAPSDLPTVYGRT